MEAKQRRETLSEERESIIVEMVDKRIYEGEFGVVQKVVARRGGSSDNFYLLKAIKKPAFSGSMYKFEGELVEMMVLL